VPQSVPQPVLMIDVRLTTLRVALPKKFAGNDLLAELGIYL
jgi:hypothetical protein